MGQIHIDNAFRNRDILHGEIEIFPHSAFRNMVETYGNVIFKSKGEFDK